MSNHWTVIRRAKRSCSVFVSFGLATSIFLFTITYGEFSLAGKDTLSEAYCSLANGIMKGTAEVDPNIMWYDGFSRDGKTYMYFGPLPAIVRIPILEIFPGYFGNLARTSCLIAGLLSLCAAYLLLTRNSHTTLFQNLFAATFPLALAVGTPLFYLMSSSRIYHEAILWGLASTLWSVHFIQMWSLTGRLHAAWCASLCAGLALLSRITMGLPLYGALTTFAAMSLLRSQKVPGGGNILQKQMSTAIALLLPAFVCGGIQLTYNYLRFGNVWQSLDLAHLIPSVEVIQGVYNPSRIIDSLRNYFLPSPYMFSGALPFPFRIVPVNLELPKLFIDWREETIPLLAGSSWLLWLALLGTWTTMAQRRFVELVLCLLFIIQCGMLCSFYFITQRYAAEFLPLLFLLSGRGVGFITSIKRRVAIVVCGTLFFALAALSSIVTVSATLDWGITKNGNAVFVREFYRWYHRENNPSPPWPGPRIYVSDLCPRFSYFGYEEMKIDADFMGNSLSARGQNYSKGLGTHAPTRLVYRVPPGAQFLSGFVGLPDHCLFGSDGSVRFLAYSSQGAVLFDSGVIRATSGLKHMLIPVNDSDFVTLRVEDGGDGISYDHANWMDLAFLLVPGSEETTLTVPQCS